MHLHLTLPESLAQHPAFSASPFAAGYAASASDSATEEAATSQVADDDEDSSSTAATIFNVGILLLIPLGMYFLLIRPNKKRRQAVQELQRSIGVGDEVLLTSGMYGFVTAMEDGSDVVWVEIDDDVQIRVTRAAISGKVSTSAEPATDAAVDDDDDDDAPADEAATSSPSKAARSARSARSAKPSKSAPARPSLKGTSTGASGSETADAGEE